MTTYSSKSDKKNKTKKNDYEEINYTKIFVGVLCFGIFLFLILLWITSPASSPTFDFSNTGQIGDTIAGITAPFIGVLGAVLVYISFLEQVKANKIQKRALDEEIKRSRNERNFNTYLDIYKELKDDFYNLSYKDKNGIEAISQYCYDFEYETRNKTYIIFWLNNEIRNEYSFLLNIFNSLYYKIDESELNKSDLTLLYDIMYVFYINKLDNTNERITKILSEIMDYFGEMEDWISVEQNTYKIIVLLTSLISKSKEIYDDLGNYFETLMFDIEN